MENDIGPAFVKINYLTEYAPHSQTIPCVPLNNVGVLDTPPNFDLRGGAIDVDADDAIKDYVNLAKALFTSATTFSDYTIYTKAGVGAVPVPVWSGSLGIVGTSPFANAHKAYQQTLSFRADDFTQFKLVYLDAIPASGNDKKTGTLADGAMEAVKNYAMANVTWMASRGGGRPATFLSLTTTLNEKLRRSYRMT